MDVPWKVIVAFLGVFVAGAIFGGVFTIGVSARRGGNALRQLPPAERGIGQLPPANPVVRPQVAGPLAPNAPPRPNAITLQLLKQFERRLGATATAEQREEMKKILGRAGEDFHRLRSENFENVGRVTERMYADISGLLTFEQRGELEKMRKQAEERLQNAGKKRDEAAAAEKGTKAPPAQPVARPEATPPRKE
jgi:hypothetical protein